MQHLLLQSTDPEGADSGPSIKERSLRMLSGLPPFARSLFVLAGLVFIVSTFLLLTKLSDRFLVEIPRHGGELVEGIIGRPRFINPVIAKSDADRDMNELIYSGLMRATPEGALIPDLARSYVVSEDGMTYTFTLADELVWHDGEPVTSGDVAFTIEKVKDPGLIIKSPRRASWDGVTVETPDPLTVVFRLKQPYAPFLESTTMGILPKHIWQNVPNEEFDVTYHNIEPIGSGPYRMGTIVEDKDTGLPKHYDLIAFKKYAHGEPYITNLRIAFFGNNTDLTRAYAEQRIDQMHTIEPALASNMERAGARITEAELPRVFALYFNQNQATIFTDRAVRKALDTAIDKEKIVSSVLFGYGRVINSPLPMMDVEEDVASSTGTTTDHATIAREILEGAGWTQNAVGIYEKVDKKKKTITPLEFSVAIPDVPELKAAAELVKADWLKIGAQVTIRVFEPSTFTTETLAPRKYDVLFYGQVIGRTPDPYAYWHSSERNAPGLNVALYANKKVDKLLEDARKDRNAESRTLLLSQFVDEVRKDTPAIFLYSPNFLYATSLKVHGKTTGLMTTESERFLGIANWYIQSERVWKWFAGEQTETTL